MIWLLQNNRSLYEQTKHLQLRRGQLAQRDRIVMGTNIGRTGPGRLQRQLRQLPWPFRPRRRPDAIVLGQAAF
jgi:hypothetical protein